MIPDGLTLVDEPAFPLPALSGMPAEGYDPFPAEGSAAVSVMPRAFTLRPFDTWAARNLTGYHGEVSRVSGAPVGVQAPVYTRRAVFRPLPQPWDEGYYNG